MSTFVVFQDVPSTPPRTPRASPATNAPLLPTNSTPAPSTPSAEKENVNPATGELSRVGSADLKSKKRKTGILATKVYAPLGEKQKEPKESKPETKKRKAVASTASKGKSSKSSQALGSSRKSKSNRSHTTSSLPKVDEEAEKDLASQREAERIIRLDIDSRVYDFTIKPLADVTRAFDQGLPSVDKSKLRTLKENSFEPDGRDYSSPAIADVPLPSKSRYASMPLATPPRVVKAFSTPERKQIYAAFTFTSPSPSAERFIKSRATSEPPTRVKALGAKPVNPGSA